MGEAGGESPLGQRAVGSVIANRVASPQYSGDWRDVMLQPRQFSVWNDVTGELGGRGSNTAWQGPIPPEISAMAADIIAGNYEDPTGGALNYANPAHSDPSNLGWINNMSGQTRIGNHLFGTAGGGGGARGRLSTSGGGGSGMIAGGQGNDTLGGDPEQSRIRQIMGGILGGDGQNPTLSANRAVSMAKNQRELARDSMDVFEQTNAPASWLNVLGTTGRNLAAGALESRAERLEAERSEKLGQLMASGASDPETIAAIAALDPELGQQLYMQERGFSREDALYERERADALSDQERLWEREDVRLAEDRAREITDREDRQQHEKEMYDPRTAVQKDAEAAGYTPGTPEYEAFIQKRYDAEESPEVKAAKIAAESNAKATNAFAETLGKKAAEGSISLSSAASQAASQQAQLDTLTDAFNNVPAGMFAPVALGVGRFLDAFGGAMPKEWDQSVQAVADQYGVSREQVAAFEYINKVSAEQLIGKIGTSGDEGGFPANNFSDKDREFLLRSIPTIQDSVMGAQAKIALTMWLNEQTIHKNNSWNSYMNGLGRPPTGQDWLDFNQQYAAERATVEIPEQLRAALEAGQERQEAQQEAEPTQGTKSFATIEEANEAAANGLIKSGDKITVGGQSGTWN